MARKMGRSKQDSPQKPDLSIEDTSEVRFRLGVMPQPYDLFDGKKSPRKKRKDLRKLSEEIKAQRKAVRTKSASVLTSLSRATRAMLFTPVGHFGAVVASIWRKIAGWFAR